MIRSLAIVVLVFALTQAHAQAKFPEHSFKLKSDPSINVGYLAYLPKTYTSDPRYTPTLIYLHANEDVGGDINRLKKAIPLSLAEKDDYNFIIIAPHLPLEHGKTWDPELVKEALEDAQKKYRIDPARVYIMGIGKGGAGAWAFCLKYPQLIAAAIPISGFGEVGWACKMKVVPTWAFHKKNNTSTANSTLNMVRSLQKCSNMVSYNEYSDHWTPQIDDKNVFEWMLAQSKHRELNTGKGKVSEGIISYRLPLALKSPSGILKANDGSIWSVNDAQGKHPLLINIDTTGKVLKTVRVSNAPNLDWEDITQDDQGNIFIGDFGNENNNRKSLNVYKVNYKDVKEKDKVEPTSISFSLSDQHSFPPSPSNMNYDIESMFWFDNALYFFSKNRTNPFTGYSKLYRVPDAPGDHVAQLLDSIKITDDKVRENGWITSADLSPDKKKLILLGYGKAWLITDFEKDSFCKGRVKEISLRENTHKKGIAFFNDTTLMVVDEYFLGTKDGNLYFIAF